MVHNIVCTFIKLARQPFNLAAAMEGKTVMLEQISTLATALMLALMGVGAEEDDHGGHGVMLTPQPIELGEDCLL